MHPKVDHSDESSAQIPFTGGKMSRIHKAIFGGLSAALISLSGPAGAAPAGFGGTNLDATSQATLVHGHGGFSGGGGFGGGGMRSMGMHSMGMHSMHGMSMGGYRFHSAAPYVRGGPVRFSGNWNHDGHHHHGHHGYPFYAFYGGYYPYYDDYYSDDYDYGYCYYSRRYHARICPDD
jgi:hypothetical protein